MGKHSSVEPHYCDLIPLITHTRLTKTIWEMRPLADPTRPFRCRECRDVRWMTLLEAENGNLVEVVEV